MPAASSGCSTASCSSFSSSSFYTVQVSFREHALIPEPFLLVALIAAIRRILILTAQFPQLVEKGEAVFGHAMIELGVLTGMIVALVISLVLVKKRPLRPGAERV